LLTDDQRLRLRIAIDNARGHLGENPNPRIMELAIHRIDELEEYKNGQAQLVRLVHLLDHAVETTWEMLYIMLTNEEFAKLEQYRLDFSRTDKMKTPAQLALEHIEALSDQHLKVIRVAETLMKQRRESWCYRVPAFFAVTWARIKHVFRKR
jgi:hypothetical protein